MVMRADGFDIHSKFTLNGRSYDKSDLSELAYDLVKEGSAFEKSIGDFLSDWLADAPTVKVHTSGSTGAPKEITLKKRHMVNSALATGQFFNLQAGNSALLCMPAHYIAGKMMLVRAMVLGLELDYVELSSNPLKEVAKTYDFAAMVPLQLEGSLEAIEKVKILIVGGAPISNSLNKKIQAKTTAIFETYGMTETITHVAVKEVGSNLSDGTENKFRALPGIQFSVDSRDCLVISACNVSDNTVVTNDIVKLVSETEFEWLGRFDNVINSGGVKLFPEQIEKKMASFLKSKFFVAGMSDEKLGEKLVLVVEGEIDSARMLQTLKENENLERFEVPKEIYAIPYFKETNTGKIKRKENLRLILK